MSPVFWNDTKPPLDFKKQAMTPSHNNPQGTAGSEQPQKEYIIIEDELDQFNENYNDGDWGNPSRKPLDERVRSRPHTSPPAPERKVCCASCPCREPNCEDDCPEWVTNNALLTKRFEDIAKAARDQLIDEFAAKFRSAYLFFDDIKFDETINSLRSQQEAEQPKEPQQQ